jgi:hypothetical protein
MPHFGWAMERKTRGEQSLLTAAHPVLGECR